MTVRRIYRRIRHAERVTKRAVTLWALVGGTGSGAAAVAHDQVAHALSFLAQHASALPGSLHP